MIDIYVLDKELNRINIIDTYESLIWANRYDEIGDCEIKINATIENLKMFQDGVYLSREDDDMVCRIEQIQLNTDIENGNYLIITGYDIKKILSQRIIWKQTNFSGLAEDYLRKLINDNIINPNVVERRIENFILDSKVGFSETINEQVTYDNLNQKIQETIKKYNWGYKVHIDNKKFKFKLYKGEDRTTTVIFSNNYENLSSTEYSENKTNVSNVALTAGEGEGVNRIVNVLGESSGLDRFEIYVDAREISKNIDYNELLTTYANGEEVTINGTTYYQVSGTNIAIITHDNEITNATLTDDMYNSLLASKGLESLSEHKYSKSFLGSVEPNLTFKYKKDYFLGDVVTVENEYGISVEARISEVIEVYDNNGYSIEPKFEYLEETIESSTANGYILAENEAKLLTEANEHLILEEGNDTRAISKEKISALALEIQDRKISELSELLEIQDNSCIPIVSEGETRKIYYQNLKKSLNNDLSFMKLGTESDPTVPACVKNITQEDINKWNNGTGNESDEKSLLLKIYPIGSIYLNTTEVNPSTLFGGTWERIANGRTLVGVDENDSDFKVVKKEGGEKKHQLIKAELPSLRPNFRVTNSNTTGGSMDYLYIGTTTAPKILQPTAGRLGVTRNVFDELGNDEAHNNLQPYLTVYIWQRVA